MNQIYAKLSVVSMQEVLQKMSELMNSVPEKTLYHIANTRRSIRERALKIITQGLDLETEEGKSIMQAIPFEFINRDDIMGALWYIETLGKTGYPIEMVVFEAVIREALNQRQNCLDAEDLETVNTIDISVAAIFRMTKSNPNLHGNTHIELLHGEYEEEIGEKFKALGYYDKVMNNGDPEGYIASARIYEQIGELAFSHTVLQAGYDAYQDPVILGNSIRVACKLGDMEGAMKKYQLLKSHSLEQIPPFILYKGRIESDQELEQCEVFITQYMSNGTYIPSDALSQLSQRAAGYIQEQIDHENDTIILFNQEDVASWSTQKSSQFSDAFFRRLWLMQVDIIALGNPRYLEYYLKDINQFGLSNKLYLRNDLRTFFMENSAVDVQHEVKKLEESGILGYKTDVSKVIGGSVFDMISDHLSRIGQLFSQSHYADIHSDYLIPMLRKAAQEDDEFEEEMDDGFQKQELSIKHESDYYGSLRKILRENYEDFITHFDKKYGTFFRRRLQMLAIEDEISSDKYPVSLTEYPDLALIFWIEKIISGQFPTRDAVLIEQIVTTHGLLNIGISEALLFGSFLYDVSPQYTVVYLAQYPDMLDVPEAIYVITESLRDMDTKERRLAIRQLHAVAKNEYEARGFFEHIQFQFGDIMHNEPDDEDAKTVHLARGNASAIQNKDPRITILHFTAAGTQYSSIEGFIQAGEAYVNIGEYDNAIACYEDAFNQEQSLNTVHKILECTIESGSFKKAEEYIHYAISQKYSIENYILAFYLHQGKTELAFLQMILMIKNKQNLVEMLSISELLTNELEFIMNTPDTILNVELDRLKIFASFIIAARNSTPENDGYKRWMEHLQQCVALTDEYEGEGLYKIIEMALSPITGEIDNDEIYNMSAGDRACEYFDTLASNIVSTIDQLIENTSDENQKQEMFAFLNNLRGIIVLGLKKLPNSEKLITKWTGGLEFKFSDGYKLSFEPDDVQGISNVLAYALIKGNEEIAFLQMITLIQEGKNLPEIFPGIYKFLYDTIHFVKKTPDGISDFNLDKLKIFATYIESNLTVNGKEAPPETIVEHWQRCLGLLDNYEGERLHEVIEQAIGPLGRDIFGNLAKDDSVYRSIRYIDHHALKILVSLEKSFKVEVDDEMRERLHLAIIHIKNTTVEALKRFPESQEFVERWTLRVFDTFKQGSFVGDDGKTLVQGYLH